MFNPADGSLALCGARSKRNEGRPCKQPAMSNGRCRLHGGKCTGPRTHEGLKRSQKARFKHGFYSAESMADRQQVRELIKSMKANLQK